MKKILLVLSLFISVTTIAQQNIEKAIGDFDEVIRLAREGELTEKNIRFFLGRAGWTASQLEVEVEEKSWVVIDNTYKSDLLSQSASGLWKKQIESFGDKYIIWSNAPEDPYDN